MNISNTGYWYGEDTHLNRDYSKELASWIAEYLKEEKNKQLYDFGCSVGYYLQHLQNLGFTKLLGFEGDPSSHRVFQNIIKQDLSASFTLPQKGNCLFLEVGEHIPAEFENIVIDNVINACDDKLIMSWAVRGVGFGRGHVNCLDNQEVIDRFVNKGMTYLESDSMSARNVIDPHKWGGWFKDTILIFKK